MNRKHAAVTAQWTGILFRSLVIGTLLFWALVEFMSLTNAGRIFKYQGL